VLRGDKDKAASELIGFIRAMRPDQSSRSQIIKPPLFLRTCAHGSQEGEFHNPRSANPHLPLPHGNNGDGMQGKPRSQVPAAMPVLGCPYCRSFAGDSALWLAKVWLIAADMVRASRLPEFPEKNQPKQITPTVAVGQL
jgi:hypothetical protein